MEFVSNFTTNFSPRCFSAKDFADRITKIVPRKEIFLIPIKSGYFTTVFKSYDTTNRWCWDDYGKKVILFDKHLIFQPIRSNNYIYTQDGKSFKQLDESKIMSFLKKYPQLVSVNKFSSKSEEYISHSDRDDILKDTTSIDLKC